MTESVRGGLSPLENEKVTKIPAEFEQFADFLKERDVRVEFPADPEFGIPVVISFSHKQNFLPSLPKGFGFSGGAAREVVFTELGSSFVPPRDIDVIAIDNFDPDTTNDALDSVSSEYMPDDWSKGHGVKFETMPGYFNDRDFTINQVLVYGDRVFITAQALQDITNRVIRVTDYEMGTSCVRRQLNDSVSEDGRERIEREWLQNRGRYEWSDNDEEEEDGDEGPYHTDAFGQQYYSTLGIKPKLVLKALRLQLELEERFGNALVEDIEPWQFRMESVNPFSVASFLDKMYQMDMAAGNKDLRLVTKFYWTLLEKGTITPGTFGRSPQEAALTCNWILERQGKRLFDFSNPAWNNLKEGDCLEDVFIEGAFRDQLAKKLE